MGGLNHTYFTYDRAYGRLTPFLIPGALRMIMAFAVLGAFPVVLRTVGDALGLVFAPLGGAFWAPSEASKVLLGTSWELLGVSAGAL